MDYPCLSWEHWKGKFGNVGGDHVGVIGQLDLDRSGGLLFVGDLGLYGKEVACTTCVGDCI